MSVVLIGCLLILFFAFIFIFILPTVLRNPQLIFLKLMTCRCKYI
uniref:Uncharacterized protein n=1 Tax=Rhizophora mucronata TaxID=61149 RepID=A0A2P2J6S3_RHIMU